MKTIIRVDPAVLDTKDPATAGQIPTLGVRMLTDSYDKIVRPEARLVVDRNSQGRQIYITIGDKPPELAIEGRKLFGVFMPLDSQDPLATFVDQPAASAWAYQQFQSRGSAYEVREVASTSDPAIRVSVVVIVARKGKFLLGKLQRSGEWALPEAMLQIGETIESAAARAVMTSCGLEIKNCAVSKTAPYVSTLLAPSIHYLTLVMLAEPINDKPPQCVTPLWDTVDFFDNAPEPAFVSVKQIVHLGRVNTPAPQKQVRASSKPKASRRRRAR